ncbi:winged helix-turn-helix transcriptional regulator [Actinocorallia populi]|nr:winged helix-turn-helix transcriptional regulator [Actinocorallia populi]
MTHLTVGGRATGKPHNGLVERRAYAEAPPRVEYGLTELGRTLEEFIARLTEWARANGEAIVSFHEAAEARDA